MTLNPVELGTQLGQSSAAQLAFHPYQWARDQVQQSGTFLNGVSNLFTGKTQANINKQNIVQGTDGYAYDASDAASQLAYMNKLADNKRADEAYQRTVKDLKAAGINPALFFSSGAPVGNYGSMSIGTSNQVFGNVKDAINSATKGASVLTAVGGLLGALAALL